MHRRGDGERLLAVLVLAQPCAEGPDLRGREEGGGGQAPDLPEGGGAPQGVLLPALAACRAVCALALAGRPASASLPYSVALFALKGSPAQRRPRLPENAPGSTKLGLQAHQPRIASPLGEELGGRAFFQNPPSLHDEDPVGVAHGGEAVGR